MCVLAYMCALLCFACLNHVLDVCRLYVMSLLCVVAHMCVVWSTARQGHVLNVSCLAFVMSCMCVVPYCRVGENMWIAQKHVDSTRCVAADRGIERGHMHRVAS